MLQGVQTEIREVGHVLIRVEDAKDAALLVHAVGLEILEPDPRAPIAEQAGLGERDGQAAIRTVVSRAQQPRTGGLAHESLHLALHRYIDGRRSHTAAVAEHELVLTRVDAITGRPNERDDVVVVRERRAAAALRVLEHSDHADDNRWWAAATRRVVVQADVATQH